MKSARPRNKRIYLSPDSLFGRADQTLHTERSSVHKFISFHKEPISSDPFREIEAGQPSSKLKPIILRHRISPHSKISNHRVSIKLPDITADGKFKRSKYMLPMFSNTIEESKKKTRLNINDEPKRMMQRVLSDGALQCKNSRVPNLELKSLRCYKSSNKLEVSFGNHNDSLGESVKNPFSLV